MSNYTACEEGVTRRQAFQPCDKPAVAMRLDPEDKKPYPVCRRHCRENMVPLAEVKAQERERMIQILERLGNHGVSHSERCLPRHWIVERAIEEIRGETSES